MFYLGGMVGDVDEKPEAGIDFDSSESALGMDFHDLFVYEWDEEVLKLLIDNISRKWLTYATS